MLNCSRTRDVNPQFQIDLLKLQLRLAALRLGLSEQDRNAVKTNADKGVSFPSTTFPPELWFSEGVRSREARRRVSRPPCPILPPTSAASGRPPSGEHRDEREERVVCARALLRGRQEVQQRVQRERARDLVTG